MTKYQMNRSDGPFTYPTLGFRADAGAILDGSLFTPPITNPPDQFWSEYTGGSAQTGITIINSGGGSIAPRIPDGRIAVYDSALGTYVPTAPSVLFADPDVAAGLTASIDDRTADAVAAAVVGLQPSTGLLLYQNADGFYEVVAPVQPAPAVPGAPTNLTATPGRGQGALTWTTPTAPSDGPITGYRIRYRTVGSSTWTVLDITGTATSRTITGLLNTIGYEAQVAGLNVSGSGPYTASATFTPGAVNGVVASDTFTRTTTDVVSSSPDVGLNPYSGATAQFQVDGARMIGKSTGAGGLVTLDLGARGASSFTGTYRTSTQAAATATTARRYFKYVDASNNIYVQLSSNTAGTSSAPTLNLNAAGVFTALATGFPATTIPSTTAEADYAIAFSLTDVDNDGYAEHWSLTVNGTTRTGDLTQAQAQALAPSTKVGYTTTTNPTNVKWDNVSDSVNGTYV